MWPFALIDGNGGGIKIRHELRPVQSRKVMEVAKPAKHAKYRDQADSNPRCKGNLTCLDWKPARLVSTRVRDNGLFERGSGGSVGSEGSRIAVVRELSRMHHVKI